MTEKSMSAESERALAITLFNQCWDLIEKPERTEEESAQMLHLAHASLYHWSTTGTEKERAIGEWQCSRVNALLGFGAAALLHAKQSAALTAALPRPHFMHASAAEGLAFAYFVHGDLAKAQEYKARALAELDGVDAKDADHIRSQINELPF
jgi:hypothetical protein